jgi:hypothetical protein
LILFLTFLFPLAVYCLLLALVNRRPHPVMVPGPWDFAGVLFAASGLLLLAGPAILSSGGERWRLFWMLGQQGGLDAAEFWTPLSLGYFAVVVFGSAFVLWLRRSSTAVYNVAPPVFEAVLAETLEELGVCWTRSGNRLFIGAADGPPPAGPVAAAPHLAQGVFEGGSPPPGGARPNPPAFLLESDQTVILTVDPFPALYHVTLRWDDPDHPLRQEVEAELRKGLQRVYTHGNPAGVWFLGAAAGLFCVIFLLMVLMILVLFNPRVK